MNIASRRIVFVTRSCFQPSTRLVPSFGGIISSQHFFSTAPTTSAESSSATAPTASNQAAPSPRPQISANFREAVGSKKSRKLREDKGLIPGVVYGIDKQQRLVKVLVSVEQATLERELRRRGASIENTVYDLVLPDGSTYAVVPRQLQLNPLTDKPVNANFLVYWPGMRLRIPIEYINIEDCVDLKRGAHLMVVNPSVECVCDGEVPQKIYVDMSKLGAGDVIRLKTLPFPPLVRPAKTVPKTFVAGVLKVVK